VLNSGTLISLISTISAWVLYALNLQRAESATQSVILVIVAVFLTLISFSVGMLRLLDEIVDKRLFWEASRGLLEKNASHADAVKSFQLIYWAIRQKSAAERGASAVDEGKAEPPAPTDR
jgi:hypothetical protein